MDGFTPVNALAAIVGSAHVTIDAAARTTASTSWYPVETKQKQANGGVPLWLVEAVVSPGTVDEVAAVVRWANQTGTPLVPVGGASNTVGSTRPPYGGVAVDLSRLQNLDWDENDLLVHAGAGWNLGQLEEKLNQHGYTLGHAPQSLYLATLGGCVATNAIGLFSGKYGRQADLTRALEAVLPMGEIVRTGSVPTSAGPDWGRLLLGSEGTLGIVTRATLQMWPLPDVRAWAVFTFGDFRQGLDALRLIHRTDARPSLVRLLDPAGAEELAQRSGLPPGEALLLLAFEGDELVQTGHYQMAHAVCQKVEGVARDPEIGAAWFEERLQTSWMAPNGRAGGLADVLAASASWSNLPKLYDALRAAIGEQVTQLHGHVGHAYATGAALDLTFQAQAEPATPQAAQDLHERIVRTATQACHETGGSIVHHYGIGVARSQALAHEQGEAGLLALQRIKTAFDPNNILNPGKLGMKERP